MNKKIRVGILFGGQSAEHEVALQSAKNIVDAIDRDRYEVQLIGIDKQGGWHLQDAQKFLLDAADPAHIRLNAGTDKLAVVPTQGHQPIVSLSAQDHEVGPLDVIFPVLHGPFGEDGTVQGLLKLAHLPFVGASVLGSAVGMDKDVMKRLLRDAGIPIPKFVTITRAADSRLDLDQAVAVVGLPCFVKPANLGSSVGITKAHDRAELRQAMDVAFQYDRKILLEEAIDGREIECAVLGNENPVASVPGEVITDRARHEFYSYDAKYLDEQGAALVIPAQLPAHLISAVQTLAVQTFQTLCCEGMGRVDCFVTADERVVINEINTIPGFTRISMYPKLWEASGIPYTELIHRLIQLGLERHAQEQTLATSKA